MRTVEINYDLNPLGDWTQASAKSPVPTALTEGPRSLQYRTDSGSAALLLYVYINLVYIWRKPEIWEPKSIFKVSVFIYSMCCLCVCTVFMHQCWGHFPIPYSMTEFLWSNTSIIFLHRLQILLRPKLLHTAVLSQECLILTHSHLGLRFPVTALMKSFFLFNLKLEASLNWSRASLVEASLYKWTDQCHVYVINQHDITWADRWHASINFWTRRFTGMGVFRKLYVAWLNLSEQLVNWKKQSKCLFIVKIQLAFYTTIAHGCDVL